MKTPNLSELMRHGPAAAAMLAGTAMMLAGIARQNYAMAPFGFSVVCVSRILSYGYISSTIPGREQPSQSSVNWSSIRRATGWAVVALSSAVVGLWMKGEP